MPTPRLEVLPHLAFFAGLLHDVGKISLDFAKSKEPLSQIADFHGQIFYTDKKIIPKELWDFLSMPWPSYPDVSMLKLVCSHHGCERCLGPDGCSGLEDHQLKKLLQLADRSDASNPSDSGKQHADNLITVGLFGFIRKVNPYSYDIKRAQLYQKLNWALKNTKSYKELEASWLVIIESEADCVLSETRKHATDLVLSGHLKSTAILFSLYVQSQQILMCSCKNTKENLYKITNPKNRIIAKDGHQIAYLSADAKASNNSSLILGPFDEVGKWLIDSVPKSPPCPKLVAKICFSSWAKYPGEIAPGYTMKRLILDLRRFVNLAVLEESRIVSLKKRGLSKHLTNLTGAKSKGKLPADLEQTIGVKSEQLNSYEEFLKKYGTPIEILSINGWQDVELAKQWAWDFLALIMSPIRPSSPVDWAKRLYAQCKTPSKREAIKWVLAKRFTLGRWFCAEKEWAKLGKMKRLFAWLKHLL